MFSFELGSEVPPVPRPSGRGSAVLALAFVSSDYLAFFFGTVSSVSRSSHTPMAIACFRLLTVLPLRPLFNVPLLRLCSALFTSSDADFEYFIGMISSGRCLEGLECTPSDFRSGVLWLGSSVGGGPPCGL